MESFSEAWSLVCDYCKGRITEVAFTTWISRIEPVELDFAGNIAVLQVPNDFHRQTLTRCYTSLLTEALEHIFGMTFNIRFVIPEEVAPKEEETVSSEDYEYTFDTFIVGPSNKFAHAACMAVATKPATLYNPLFIYGNSGLGKTHLLRAIYNSIAQNYPEMTIIYIKGDDFTNEMIDAIRHGTTQDFHERYRKADILLVDDIHALSQSDSTQEEFFHTFNSLYEAHRQIVLTSDRPAKDIATLEERLLTRFEWGLTADVQPPDFETRIAIIRRKAELLQIDIPDVVCEYIANRVKNNIRQLEGIVKKMKAYYLLNGDMPSINTAQAAISDIMSNEQPTPLTVEKIIEEVARTFGVSAADIRSSKRSSNISKARQMAMYVVREITQLPTASIGEEFGGRDHSTVVYSLQEMEKKIGKDSRTRATAEDIIKNIRDR